MSAIIKICVGHVVAGEPLGLPDGEYALTPVTQPVAAGTTDTCADMRALCSACGGTGDVHRADGEWLGECKCMAALLGRAEKAEAEVKQVNEWRAAALAESQRLGELWAAKVEAADASAAELGVLLDASGKLIKAKGRHHTELNYQGLVDAYDAAAKGGAAGSAP
jgi:hypothetical protein